MKYRLETIPVWRAYEQDADCPLCLLRDQAEAKLVSSFLGGLVMSPPVRKEVNDAGFCPRHYWMLFEQQEGKLGLALMSHTHLVSRLERLRRVDRELLHAAGARAPGKRGAMQAVRRLAAERDRCVICPRLLETSKRYAFTIIHEWERDPQFHATLLKSSGFCLEHYALIMELAAEVLRPASFTSWCREISGVQEGVMQMMEEDLLAFTQRFDYRRSGGDWQRERGVLRRAVSLLAGSHGRKVFTLHQRLLEGKVRGNEESHGDRPGRR